MGNKKVDYKATSEYIVKWIEKKAEEAGAKALVVGLSGGIDSSLTAALCKKTRIPVVGVNMPCHSGKDSGNRAKILAKHLGIKFIEADLTEAFDKIEEQIQVLFDNNDHKKLAQGSFRSRMRTPVLGYVAKVYKGIIVGTGNRSEDSLLRYFDKYGDGAVDISILNSLFKREVYEMAEFLGLPQEVLNATPSAELWGDEEQSDEDELGMSYDEVEWAERHMILNKLPLKGEDMILEAENKDLTSRQKFVLKEVASHEIKTRHKLNPNLPICEVPEEIKGDI